MKGSPISTVQDTVITGNAVIEDCINGANAGINLPFLYSEVVSFPTTLTVTTGHHAQSVLVRVDIRNSLQHFVFQLEAEKALPIKHPAFVLCTSKHIKM